MIFKKYHIHRILFNKNSSTYERIKNYLNHFIGTSEINEENLKACVLEVVNRIDDQLHKKIFLAGFNLLFGFKSCQFNIINKNDIKYNSMSEYLIEAIFSFRYFLNWDDSSFEFCLPDKKGELENEIIKVSTSEGMKVFKNPYTVYKF